MENKLCLRCGKQFKTIKPFFMCGRCNSILRKPKVEFVPHNKGDDYKSLLSFWGNLKIINTK